MPVIDGKVRRSRFTSLKLRELSSVDNPAQIGARMAIMKRDFSAKEREAMAQSGDALPDGSFPIATTADLENAVHAIGRAKDGAKAKAHIITRARSLGALDALPEEWNVKKLDEVAGIAKYLDPEDGAHTFQEVLADNKFDQNVWPCVDALSQSIRSIVGDSSLAGGERDAKISASVQQFLQSVRDISPEVSKQLEPLLVRKRDDHMAKTVEELQGEVDSLTSKLAIATADVAKANAAQTAAEEAKTKAEQDCATAKAALVTATDETLKVGEVEVKKSEFGTTQFAVLKAERDEKLTSQLEKRATEEFPHVVGTATEKALVLKTVAHLDAENPARKALEAILTSAEKMVAAGFDRMGGMGGATPTQKAAANTFNGKVAEIQKRDECTRTQAMSKARSEFPAEFEAAYPDEGASAQAAN